MTSVSNDMVFKSKLPGEEAGLAVSKPGFGSRFVTSIKNVRQQTFFSNVLKTVLVIMLVVVVIFVPLAGALAQPNIQSQQNRDGPNSLASSASSSLNPTQPVLTPLTNHDPSPSPWIVAAHSISELQQSTLPIPVTSPSLSPARTAATSPSVTFSPEWERYIASNPFEAFVEAVFDGNEDLLRRLIPLVDINSRFWGEPATALYLATYLGHESIVDILLEAGANPNIKTGQQKSTPLHQAIFQKHLSIASKLLLAGGDVNAMSDSSGTPLHLAVFLGDEKAVQFLIQNGAKTDLSFKGSTPYQLAVDSRNLKLARLLGPEVVCDKYGFWPGESLYRAIEAHDMECIEKLAKNSRINNPFYNPLSKAIELGYEDVVRLLVSNGADVNAATGFHGWECAYPIIDAVKRGNVSMMRCLFELGANLNPHTCMSLNNLLHIAVESGSYESVSFLLENGLKSSINSKNFLLKTPFDIAMEKNDVRLGLLLIKNGANVNCGKCKGGYHPIQLAVSSGNLEFTKLIVENGGNLDVPMSPMRKTLMHYAAESGSPPLVQYLLDKGLEGDLDKEDARRQLPIHIAKEKDFSKVVVLLERAQRTDPKPGGKTEL